MKQNIFNSIKNLTILIVFVLVSACSTTKNEDISERTKIALRDVGNKLLLSNKDSTSLVLPIIALEVNKYQLDFSNQLSFEPSHLVSIVQESLKAAQLPEHYRVEVLQSRDREVAYSYQMSDEAESTIIPCAGRYLPEANYIIEVKFTNRDKGLALHEVIFYTIITLVLLSLGFLIFKKLNNKKLKSDNEAAEKIGSFYFYPKQLKLVKEAKEIALSNKECELLALFIANPNQIIKRDELNKRVWEDNGVFVSRSLDTYISKLRKKLKSDTSIKLTNIHGVGYKLEIN